MFWILSAITVLSTTKILRSKGFACKGHFSLTFKPNRTLTLNTPDKKHAFKGISGVIPLLALYDGSG